MEYVVAARAPMTTTMSRRTRHPHHHHHQQHQIVDLLPPPPPAPDPHPPQVLELKQQLSNEQTVHSILERALHPTATRSAAALSSIPAFIPSKAKELLAELVLVEEEIARLESQIVTMKQDRLLAQQERSSTMETAVQQEGRRPSSIATAATAPMPYTSNANGSGAPAPASVAPEIKSMFFISQAMNMNAEYLNRHLAADATKSPKDHHHTAASISPKFNTNIFNLPPRNSLDKQSNHRAAAADQKPSKPVQEHSPTSAKREEQSSSKIQPNKLSERIVKCLVCIFIRMLRSSRAVEMEKSGSLARSGKNTPQGSFRIDTGLNVAAGVAKEKDRRGQQDHYGIFAIQDSVVRDIGPYKNLVRFTSSSFDPRGFSSSPLLTKLREMLEALQQVDLRFLTHQQKLAFWLNIYNTCIMHGILQHGLPSNSEKLLALKNKATINVSGQMFNALVIENFILRQPSSVKEEFWKCDVDVEEQQVRGLYGLHSSEPNILFALCCGIRSSPALRIYRAERVIMELEKAKLDYLQASLVVASSSRKVMIPGLLHSNMHDFGKDMESLLRWVCEQLPTSWSLRKSMVDCLRGQSSNLKVEDVVEVIPCDYEFQYLLPM
ncbi:uncharacterized protein LOC100823300 isoform X3 [Brachypodium distachyon]|uniref:DUF547 domain-containing protein n=1 Tax=Brachypodium distachyon TaxID=15368 RepID=A0A0Q3J1Z4_BRADI|nr:uncharacterized protein LOC100823300 isoform X3 [Brachypodium distachyon]KQK11971.1 hypothetical protein BRADI_1g00710v3 [Brachypodium distachyon]|eukprot:XP_014751927.1 uncharacterized protein LOC100823300 isoform X3 [Brachypodium distachyon]